jgi:hypothetical protein
MIDGTGPPKIESLAAEKNIPCRVCQESAKPLFSRTIKSKYTVRYFRCANCGHVQTEEPWWLEQTYREATFELDVGMADRSIWTAQTMAALALELGIAPRESCVDWGAGTGLFVRLCRDYGLNFFYFDPYSQNVFARGFEFKESAPLPCCACVSAFEVAEHFADPVRDFAGLFRLASCYVLFSTTLYQGESSDWWYFGEDGQHVAFYTRRSLEILGGRHGWHLASNGADLHLFSREPVSDKLLDSCRKSRVKLADKYRKKWGSRLMSDFEGIVQQFRQRARRQAGGPAA